MDHKALARKIREAIFDQAEQDGRVMHADAMDAVIEGILAKAAIPPMYRAIVQNGTTISMTPVPDYLANPT